MDKERATKNFFEVLKSLDVKLERTTDDSGLFQLTDLLNGSNFNGALFKDATSVAERLEDAIDLNFTSVLQAELMPKTKFQGHAFTLWKFVVETAKKAKHAGDYKDIIEVLETLASNTCLVDLEDVCMLFEREKQVDEMTHALLGIRADIQAYARMGDPPNDLVKEAMLARELSPLLNHGTLRNADTWKELAEMLTDAGFRHEEEPGDLISRHALERAIVEAKLALPDEDRYNDFGMGMAYAFKIVAMFPSSPAE